MKRYFTLFVFMSFLLTTGCATMSPEKRARLMQIAETPIYCHSEDECQVKWGRAILWVSDHSRWKIRNQTDSIITTEGPSEAYPFSAAYVVNRLPLGGGNYQILVKLGCASSAGCIPDEFVSKADFVSFVGGGVGNATISQAQGEKTQETKNNPSKNVEFQWSDQAMREGLKF